MSTPTAEQAYHSMGLEPGYMVPDVQIPSISVNERVQALGTQVINLEKLMLDADETTKSRLNEQIDDIRRHVTYWMERPEYRPEGTEQPEGPLIAYEVWTGPTLDESLTISRQVDNDHLPGRLSMRPSDPEGSVHRKLLYAELEVDYRNVLSPRLSSGADVAIVSDPGQLFYDQTAERFSIKTEGQEIPAVFDGWLLTDRDMAKNVPIEMAVADCPAVFFKFSKKGSTVASGGAHAGWPNMLHGLAENFKSAVKKSGIDYDAVEVIIGPGATSLTLPSRLLNEFDVSGYEEFFVPYKEDIAGFEGQDIVKHDSVEFASKKFTDVLKQEGIHVNVEDTGLNTLDKRNRLASYRREGKYANDDISQERPLGGRFLAVYVPNTRGAHAVYRNNLNQSASTNP